jgi:hypothetical protein
MRAALSLSAAALIATALIAVALAPGCKSVECAKGTIERDGVCQPADLTTSTATCGPFTILQGDQCVSMFPPTVCDPASTTADLDSSTGVTTCIGTGTGGGCSATFACPAPAAGKQTICGQLYNFTDNTKFAATGATGAQCPATPTSSGPCALQMRAFDAIAFATSPMTTAPQATGAVYIDDCGRYRVPDITPPSGPFIALGIDDGGQPFGPSGVTVTTGVAVQRVADMKTTNVEAWIVNQTTIGTWQATGGPLLADGIFAAVFRQHSCNSMGVCTGDGFANRAGVTITKAMQQQPANDFYFQAEPGRLHIETTATSTSENGTALYTGASVNDGLVYSGTGGLTDTTNCQWETHPAASIPGLVFIQVFRPTSVVTHTCTE